ncbi:hypothetical protein [Bartonella sp. CL435QHHD]|uniref:hypothetical protein n=1 Tax=Bartonella sp. CL435QHHD TaxID=3243530 RepID=UPI0035CF1F57
MCGCSRAVMVVGRIWGKEGANGGVKVGLCNASKLKWGNGELGEWGNGGRWGKRVDGNE